MKQLNDPIEVALEEGSGQELITGSASMANRNKEENLENMRAILSQFTEEQMNRYSSFRRSKFHNANMRRLLVSITGEQIPVKMNIAVSAFAKMFVGDLVETARAVMTERNDSGPICPSHIREAHRRLKIEGKVPRKSVPRLFQ